MRKKRGLGVEGRAVSPVDGRDDRQKANFDPNKMPVFRKSAASKIRAAGRSHGSRRRRIWSHRRAERVDGHAVAARKLRAEGRDRKVSAPTGLRPLDESVKNHHSGTGSAFRPPHFFGAGDAPSKL